MAEPAGARGAISLTGTAAMTDLRWVQTDEQEGKAKYSLKISFILSNNIFLENIQHFSQIYKHAPACLHIFTDFCNEQI